MKAGAALQALSANIMAPPDGEVKEIASLQKVLRAWMDYHDFRLRLYPGREYGVCSDWFELIFAKKPVA